MKLRNYVSRWRHKFRDFRNSFRSHDKIFTEIYEKRYWGTNESASGSGSTLEGTSHVRKIIEHVVSKYEIKTLLDLPCGDFNWMSHIRLDGIKYLGADIVRDLIDLNNQKYKTDNRSFFYADVIKSDLPSVDLILCRDCLVHFSNEDILLAIKNMKASNSTFLLTTVFPGWPVNENITTGNWRPIDLQQQPFNFEPPIEVFNEFNEEVEGKYRTKSLALWNLNSV